MNNPNGEYITTNRSNRDISIQFDDRYIALNKAISEGRPIVIYRYMNTQKTVGHAYYLKSYSLATKKYVLHNPWGHSHVSLTISELRSQCYGFAIGSKIR
jgi:hypothetical protein